MDPMLKPLSFAVYIIFLLFCYIPIISIKNKNNSKIKISLLFVLLLLFGCYLIEIEPEIVTIYYFCLFLVAFPLSLSYAESKISPEEKAENKITMLTYKNSYGYIIYKVGEVSKYQILNEPTMLNQKTFNSEKKALKYKKKLISILTRKYKKEFKLIE
ncbi:hypothetical protein SAMN04489761_3456 [Tenacibaculum sp. MAR_2009_124]|uniref:hypothetical protein n=1 Tax=Tenacibaculum sp. MAR_2009_124 TaxID=1250059 RepID=UPI0008999BE7|nr:hypothetical protein [Tenacibaculum sp. MAR_2009_124]SEC67001.1 hypothetical protein SAMN04489761_3456 [Tenacibaculum sp. MAR_2009_124]